MSLDLLLITDLILVKAEVVFQFTKRFFDAPAKQVSKDGCLGGHGEIICDQDMNVFVVRV